VAPDNSGGLGITIYFQRRIYPAAVVRKWLTIQLRQFISISYVGFLAAFKAIEVCMGMGFPVGMGFPWDSHGNGNEKHISMGMGMGMGIVMNSASPNFDTVN